MAVLEEIGQPYEARRVDYEGGENQTPSYLSIQPLGLIPALEFADGGSMFESAAIVLFLCDRHRRGDLAPGIEEPERAAFLQWLFFLADTVYPAYNRFYRPEKYTTDPSGAAVISDAARASFTRHWGILEDRLKSEGPWLLGNRFSACDIYMHMVSSWDEDPMALYAAFPRLRDVAAGVMERPACRKAFGRHIWRNGLEPS
jgi:glutathione S-transferase